MTCPMGRTDQRRRRLSGAAGLLATAALAMALAVPLALAGPVGVVSVTGGQVQGVATDVPGVQVFKGVPFAGPTGGAQRFSPPKPVVAWTGVKQADAWGDAALQDMQLNPVGAFWGDEFYYNPAFQPKASEDGLT